eukprot:scaffold212960_cov20-Prasinocladus_malaysianus.AAC.1
MYTGCATGQVPDIIPIPECTLVEHHHPIIGLRTWQDVFYLVIASQVWIAYWRLQTTMSLITT